ncbi:MAG: hypothetical protein AAFZ09_07560, partial [Pseudomonadota bacterium]
MSDRHRRVDVRLGAFACPIEGFDDPAPILEALLATAGAAVAARPALCEAGLPVLDTALRERILAEASTASGMAPDTLDCFPGILVTARLPETAAMPPAEAADGNDAGEEVTGPALTAEIRAALEAASGMTAAAAMPTDHRPRPPWAMERTAPGDETPDVAPWRAGQAEDDIRAPRTAAHDEMTAGADDPAAHRDRYDDRGGEGHGDGHGHGHGDADADADGDGVEGEALLLGARPAGEMTQDEAEDGALVLGASPAPDIAPDNADDIAPDIAPGIVPGIADDIAATPPAGADDTPLSAGTIATPEAEFDAVPDEAPALMLEDVPGGVDSAGELAAIDRMPDGAPASPADDLAPVESGMDAVPVPDGDTAPAAMADDATPPPGDEVAAVTPEDDPAPYTMGSYADAGPVADTGAAPEGGNETAVSGDAEALRLTDHAGSPDAADDTPGVIESLSGESHSGETPSVEPPWGAPSAGEPTEAPAPILALDPSGADEDAPLTLTPASDGAFPAVETARQGDPASEDEDPAMLLAPMPATDRDDPAGADGQAGDQDVAADADAAREDPLSRLRERLAAESEPAGSLRPPLPTATPATFDDADASPGGA